MTSTPNNVFKETFALGRSALESNAPSAGLRSPTTLELGLIWGIALWSNGGSTDQGMLTQSAQMIQVGFGAAKDSTFIDLDDSTPMWINVDGVSDQVAAMTELGMPPQMGEYVAHAILHSGHLDSVFSDTDLASFTRLREAAIAGATSMLDPSIRADVMDLLALQFNAGAGLAFLLYGWLKLQR